jgi:hypothetical protein
LISGINGLDKIEKKHGNGIADTLWDLKWRGNDIIYDRVEKYGIECDLKSGFVEVATKRCESATNSPTSTSCGTRKRRAP